MLKHTKLPWIADEKYNLNDDSFLFRGDGCVVGSAWYLGGTSQAKANAAFIVKAVNEREELITLLKLLTYTGDYENRPPIEEVLNRAREAIKQAEES